MIFISLFFMCRLKLAVIFHQFIEGNRMVAVQIYTGVQHIVPAANQRPEIRIGIRMNMTVNHIGAPCVFPRQHWIVTECQGMYTIRNLQKMVYTEKIAVQINLSHPRTVMVAHNQAFLAFQPL